MNGVFKKALSFFLTATLLITCAFSVVSATETDDGYTVITTVAQLDAIRNNIDENGKIYGKYRLGADIVFSEDETFVPIGNSPTGSTVIMFIGEFDGNGHTIKNLTVKSNVQKHSALYLGLFAYNNGTIKNIKIENFNIKITSCDYLYIGAIAGSMGRGKIINCSASGNINIDKVSSSYNTRIGGIVGANFQGTISDTVSSVNINYIGNTNEALDFGGISANNSGTIIRCGNKGSITALSSNDSVIAGGIVGKLTGTTSVIENCYNIAPLTAESKMSMCLGGIAGIVENAQSETKLLHNLNTGKITPTAHYSGGGFSQVMATVASGAIIGNFNGDSENNLYLKGTYNTAATNVNYSGTSGKDLKATECDTAVWYLPTDTSQKTVKNIELYYESGLEKEYNAINIEQPTIKVEFDDTTSILENNAISCNIKLGTNNSTTLWYRGFNKESQFLGYEPGDVDFNATVNVTDILKVLEFVVDGIDLEEGTVPADTDKNELVTVTDIVNIRKMILE